MKAKHVLFVISLVAFPLFDAMGQQAFDVIYIEYPPYYFTNNGKPDGYLLSRVSSVFNCARIDYRLMVYPSNRALHEVRTASNTISIGWFKTQDREQFANYSLPLCQARPQVAVYLKKNEDKFAEFRSLKDLLSKSNLKIGAIKGHSEGETVDSIIRNSSDNVILVGAEQINLIAMLGAERFEFILLPPEEVQHLLASSGMNPRDFEMKTLDDIPPGNKRYLIFSKDISDETIHSINTCIAKSHFER
ncbi:type 2 periplasmic-binding domain-containing protein [Fundidesulfovibrio putealis]|uniref:transporter substrate-binding domain-containing protein n=1 Tax=Fundidesulfovibrio putealis TaxID=270496 RepID=UPI000A06D637|nr:transporter substrate-binding domain-containing protein [Fundidesulfovibrio putealis]